MGRLEGTIYQGMYVPMIYIEVTAPYNVHNVDIMCARLLLCISPVYHKVHLSKFPNQVIVHTENSGFLLAFIYRKDQNASWAMSVYTSEYPN